MGKLISLTVCVLLISAVSCTHNKERREKNKERKEKKGRKEKKNDNGGNQNNGGGCGIKYYTVQETEYQTSCSNTYKTQCSTSYKTQCSTSYKTVCNQVPQTTIQNQCTQQHIQQPGRWFHQSGGELYSSPTDFSQTGVPPESTGGVQPDSTGGVQPGPIKDL